MINPVEPKVHKKSWFLFRALFSRTTLLLIFLIIQISFIYAVFTYLNHTLAYGFFILLSLTETFIIVNSRSIGSNLKIAWIVPILAMPVFGGLFYIYYKLQGAVYLKNKAIEGEVKKSSGFMRQDINIQRDIAAENNEFSGISEYLYRTCGFPAYEGDEITHYDDGTPFFESLFSELEKAEHFIFLEYFIISFGTISDRFFKILKDKAENGVEIYLIYDGTNMVKNLPFSFAQKLNDAGIHTKVFSELKPMLKSYQNHRDHRKICVIDGKTAFTGGINIADEYANLELRFGTWKDSGVMIKGPSVNSFSMIFMQSWNSIYVPASKIKHMHLEECSRLEYGKYYIEHKEEPFMEESISVFKEAENDKRADMGRRSFLIPYADSPLDGEKVGENVYCAIINTAARYLYICTPYLILDDEMVQSLCFASKRGVDVKIMLPHIPDKPYAFWLAHAYYYELIESGVEIYEYMPGFVHTKEFICDDIKGVVGTINLDYRSLYLHFENAVFLYNSNAIMDMKKSFMNSLRMCRQITMEEYNSYSKVRLFIGRALKIIAPLF